MKILLVDDQETNRRTLGMLLQREKYQTFEASNGIEALHFLNSNPIDLVITDLKMPRLNGMDLLREIKNRHSHIEVVITTAFGEIEKAVEAMKLGAWDFMTKPIKKRDILFIVKRVEEKWLLNQKNRHLDQKNRHLSQENQQLKAELAKVNPKRWIGQSLLMQQLTQEAMNVADSEASVLLLGRSGTGKSLLAKQIHNASPRNSKPFITLNCGAIPENLMESEMFGHEKGAFTSALKRKQGKFELASQGTLFLDEVTEMAPHLQVKLLRVLQEGEFERVGGSETLKTQARIIAASNQDIQKAVEEGRFRSDLYYRLNVIQLTLPSLEDRKEDIPLLVEYFLEKHAKKNNRPHKNITKETLDILQQWHWPGNVRELENIIERAVVLSKGNEIEKRDLPPQLHHYHSNQILKFPIGTPIRDIEKAMILATLRLVNGDKTKAAEILGITARTIYRKEAEWKAIE